MKILVDEMPKTPQDCIFGIPPENKWWSGPPIRMCSFLKMRYSGPDEGKGDIECPGPNKCEFCRRYDGLISSFNPCF